MPQHVSRGWRQRRQFRSCRLVALCFPRIMGPAGSWSKQRNLHEAVGTGQNALNEVRGSNLWTISIQPDPDPEAFTTPASPSLFAGCRRATASLSEPCWSRDHRSCPKSGACAGGSFSVGRNLTDQPSGGAPASALSLWWVGSIAEGLSVIQLDLLRNL